MPYKKSNKSIQDSAFKLRSGNTTPFKQMGSKEYKYPVSRLLEKGKRTYETIKYRLKKSKLLHPPTEFEKIQDYNDARVVEHKGWGDEKMYQKYKKKTERRRPNMPKRWWNYPPIN